MEEKIEEKLMYGYDDNICFRKCSLSEQSNKNFGNCTKFYCSNKFNRIFNVFDSSEYFSCNQHGFHFYCNKHQSIELEEVKKNDKMYLKCLKCDNLIEIISLNDLMRNCQKKLNILEFKDAKFIRLDDWYVSELKKTVHKNTDYWIRAEVKTDKDKDTMIVLYIGNKNTNEKAQYFIKPEKLQLTHDHKDIDPATIISKIEVTLKDRTLKETFEDIKDIEKESKKK